MKRASLLLAMILASILTAVPFAQNPTPANLQLGSIAGILQTIDGKPAANVRISAMSADSNPQTGTALLNIVQTDASGRYKLENVRPGRYYVVAGLVDLPSYFPGVNKQDAATLVTVGAQEAVTGIDFRMAVAPGLRFSGRVIREDGQGVVIPMGPAGTPFQLMVGAPATQPSQVRLIGAPPASPGNLLPSAAIAADGTFEIANIRPGTYQVDTPPVPIAAPNMRRSITFVDTDITNYELIVPMMAQLQGTVTVEGGGPVPRLQLDLTSTFPPRPTQPAPPRVNAGATFTTRLQLGEYKVAASGLPAGFVIRSIKAGAADLLAGTLKITANEAPQIAIVLGITSPSPYVSLSGRVFGRARRQNVINLNITNANSPGILEPIFYLDGTFEVPMTLPGEHRIRTGSLPSYGSLYSTTLVGPAGSADGALYVIDEDLDRATRSGSGVRVLGRIVGHSRSYPGSRVRLRDVALGETLSTTIFMDGTFEFPQVPQGSYLAEVLPAVPGASPTPVVVGFSDLRDLRIVVPDTRDIAGRVTAPAGYPLPRTIAFSVAAGEPVQVALLPDGSFQTTLPDKQRTAVVEASIPAGYSVDAVTYGGLDLLSTPFVFSGQVGDELRVTLGTTQRTTKVSGQVVGFAALPPEGRVWLIDSTGVHQPQETSIAADGTFVFSQVTSGSRPSEPGFYIRDRGIRREGGCSVAQPGE